MVNWTNILVALWLKMGGNAWEHRKNYLCVVVLKFVNSEDAPCGSAVPRPESQDAPRERLDSEDATRDHRFLQTYKTLLQICSQIFHKSIEDCSQIFRRFPRDSPQIYHRFSKLQMQ